MFSKPIIRNFFKFTNFQQKPVFLFSKQYRKPSQNWVKRNDAWYQKRNIQTLYNLGLYSLIFGLCYAMVPFYKLFCETVGLDGDLNQKDYNMKGSNLQIHRKFKINFQGESDPEINWEFEPCQTEMFVNAGETALTFYKAQNNEKKPIIGFATYSVFPEEASLYFSKVQCFCFHQQMLNPNEELQLPIYFYLEPEILDDIVLQKCQDITIVYRFYKAKKQDIAEMAEQELKKMEENKRILAEMRATKQIKEFNLSNQYQFGEVKDDDNREIIQSANM